MTGDCHSFQQHSAAAADDVAAVGVPPSAHSYGDDDGLLAEAVAAADGDDCTAVGADGNVDASAQDEAAGRSCCSDD